MIDMNPISTEEEVSAENTNTKRMIWGTIAMDLIAMSVFAYFLAYMQGLDKTPIIYAGMAVFLGTFLAALSSIILTIRGRQKLGAEIVLYSISVLGISMIALFQGRTLTASFSIFTISVIAILYLLPRQSRRWYFSVAVVSVIGMWVLEWIDPSWRIQLGAANVGPAAAIVFAIILAVMVAREAWNRNNIRSRFLTFSLGLTLLATVVIAAISVYSLLSAGEQAQETSSSVLRNQAQDFLVEQTVDVANTNELILQRTSRDAEDVAQQAAYILEHPDAFNTDSSWNADDYMFFGPEGQYINDNRDVSTVFVPNTVRVNENFKQLLSLSAYMDMVFVPVYDSDPNSVAIYFISKDEMSRLYPNINLGEIVPPDYLATQDIFYTIGSPENDPERQIVWTPVYDDPAGQGLLVSAIAPVYTGNTFMGVIGIDVSLSGLTTAIEQGELESGGYSLLLDKDGRALALPEQGYLDFYGRQRETDEFGSDFTASARPEFASVLSSMFSGSTGFQSLEVDGRELYIAYTTLESTGWHVASVVSANQVLAPATALQTQLGELSNSLVFQRILPVGIVFVILAVVVGMFFTNRLVNPLEQLTEGAAKIGEGQWDTPLPQSDLNEISGLSGTLSNMAKQLKNTLGTLEQRVADRTHNLQLAAEVGRSVSQVRELDVMLKDACELILKEFDLYYVQVYLADPAQTKLVLEAGTGDVGAQLLARDHSLPLNTGSINGRAAVEKRSAVISDTTDSATFRPNPLLPDTRGEMAVPLVVSDKVVGVLDMQSSESDVLNEGVLPAFEALAGQLAVAIQNATLLEEAEQARAEVEAQARRQAQTNWNQYLDAIHKPEQIGFVFDRKDVHPLAETESPQAFEENGNTVSAPIAVTGETLGSLVVEIEDETQNEKTSELATIVARQVAQQIENLRLLESAERYRYESEQAARLQTREGWQAYIKSRDKANLGYLYDLNEVRPHSNGQDDATALTLPLKAREETVGKLSVQGLSSDEQESFELANAVAERLGAHIESLRLFEETRRGQFELDKRARQLAAVAQVSTASSQELNVEKMLETVVHLTQRQFDLYHAHIFTFYEETDVLKIVACGWKEGEEHEGTHGSTAIPLSQEQSLVARAARLKQAVVVNDVRNEPGWLPNPQLPETRAELAVPLLVGDQLLGVLDVQSDQVNAFTDEDANIQLTLASQVAIALQNADSFAQAQRQAEREAMLNTINQKIQSATSVEAVLQIAARELGHALGAPMTIAQLSMEDQK